MIITPFNEEVHKNLLALGYEFYFNEADWEDVGDAENGPKLRGGPAFDEYTKPGDSLVVYIDEDGSCHADFVQPSPEF